MVVQRVAVIAGHPAPTLHDKQTSRYREYHSPLRALFRAIPRVLHYALVRVSLARIFRWEHVVWTSFIAGVIQTLLYADFMYYFVKANQNDKFMVFPV